jgi:hypothetical protein
MRRAGTDLPSVPALPRGALYRRVPDRVDAPALVLQAAALMRARAFLIPASTGHTRPREGSRIRARHLGAVVFSPGSSRLELEHVSRTGTSS